MIHLGKLILHIQLFCHLAIKDNSSVWTYIALNTAMGGVVWVPILHSLPHGSNSCIDFGPPGVMLPLTPAYSYYWTINAVLVNKLILLLKSHL